MKVFVPHIDRPFTVRGTEISPDDTPEIFLRKLARITLDEMLQFAGVLNTDGILLDCNRAALDGGALTRDQMIGKPFWENFWWTISPAIQEELREAIGRAARGEFVRCDVAVYGRKTGTETRIIDFTLLPVRDDTGAVVLILAEGRDITEKKAHERELARQHEELAKLDQAKTQFFANISHEFRTPLTLMLGPLEDALANTDGILPLGAARNLTASHRNALRLLKLVNAMLDFSRIAAGRVDACYQPTEIDALTAGIAGSFRPLCEKAGLRLTINCPPLPLGEPVYLDHDGWEKIVLNLLSNALKFTLAGEIEIRVEKVDHHARLIVRDTGVGISPEELPHMFEHFHRVEDHRGRTHEGVGIGLALVRELVRLHGGEITVTSALHQGTTFTVTIPLGKGHLNPDQIANSPAPASSATPALFIEEASSWLTVDEAAKPAATSAPETAHAGNTSAQIAGPEKPRILWADDNSDMRDYVKRILSERFDVQAVADGEAALAAARENPPALILADIMMPKLDGFGLLSAVRVDSRLREIPVILLSAGAGEETRLEGIEAGADDYLVKPFSARELLARVDTHLKLSSMRREAKNALLDSEERFRTFADTAPAILFTTETDGSCSFISRGWYEFTGQSEAAALGFGWLQVIHPDDREPAKATILEATKKQEDFSLDFRLCRADGQYRWALSTGRPRYDRDGFAGFIGSVIDINERKQAAQSSGLLSAIVDSSDDAIISKDLTGTIMSWNKGAERLFGYTAAEAVGRSILMLIPPDLVSEEPEILARLKRGERIEHFHTIRMRKDGTPLNISLTISPVKDASGKIVGASKIARDITDRVHREQALTAANAALKKANSDLQQFAYSASHDLQEPLRMVASFGQLMKKRYGGQLGDGADEYLGYIVEGALRMDHLLRDLRVYTHVSMENEEPLEVIDANDVLKKTLANLAVAINESGALVNATPLPRLRMHEFELEQLFQNLIGNAIRYRRASPPRINIAAQLNDNEWIFSVEDNGIGIDPQFQEQVFGMFKRLHSAADYPGTGMGLAICLRIVERSGGRIWVKSEKGLGSTFFFTIRALTTPQETDPASPEFTASESVVNGD